MTDEPRLRPDARRNRERLLAAAAEAFATDGIGTSLEEIARRAGVGIGTLYRHFPSRDALVAAVYRREVERLCDPVPELLDEMPPDEALRAWMGRFVGYTATKQGLGEALQAAMASDSELFADSYGRLAGAIETLVSAAVAAGAVRADACGEDVLRALGAIWMIRSGDDRQAQADRVLDLVIDGQRFGAPGPPAGYG